MGLLRFLTLLAFFITLSYARPLSSTASSNSTLRWGDCDDVLAILNSTEPVPNVPFDCANLTVPLDYTSLNTSAPMQLALIRRKASVSPRLGTVLFNPGGPGASGVQGLVGGSKLLQKITGPQFDVIGFDPRGTGRTIPYICEDAATNQTLVTSKNVTEELFGNWDAGVAYADTCYEQNKDKGAYLSTAFVARDMLSIIDALDEHELSFFGGSYGTQLGATFAAMFPDRVGRMVLDSVVNPHTWVNGHESADAVDTQKTWEAFMSECVTAPNACRLRSIANVTNPTATQLRLAVEAGIDAFLSPDSSRYSEAAYLTLKSIAFTRLYNPRSWLKLSEMLFKALSPAAILPGPLGESEGPINPYELPLEKGVNSAIRCLDSSFRASRPEELVGLANEIQQLGYFSDIMGQTYECAVWRFKAKELYDGDFVAKTANPILFVTGSHDPITPMAAAFNASAGFEGSVVLKNNGFGHGLTSDHSECILGWVRRYFATGELPPKGTICEPEKRPFEIGWKGPGSPYQSEPFPLNSTYNSTSGGMVAQNASRMV